MTPKRHLEINWPLSQPFVVYYVNEVEALSLKSTSSDCEFSEMLLSENQLFGSSAGSDLQAINLEGASKCISKHH